jgi:predicted dehydrogenase
MKIGILSFAHLHAEAYIQNLRAAPGVEMIGIADEDPARGERFASQFNAHFFRSYEELLAARPDGVVICSENNKHRPLVEMAASAGVQILCEKPLATTLEDSRAILSACDKAGVMLMTAFPMRFNTPLMEVKQRLDAGDLGQVFCFNAANRGELPKKHRDWFVDPVLAGGGALTDHTVHLVDVMRWYLNSEVCEVYAQSNRIFHANEVEVETGGLVMLRFDNGAFASIDCSWSRPPYWPSWGGLEFEMVTDRGSVLVDAFRQNLTIFRSDLQRPVWGHWGSDSNQAMVNDFVDAIRRQRPPRVSGLDGHRAVEVVQAAYQSAKSGQPVLLEH